MNTCILFFLFIQNIHSLYFTRVNIYKKFYDYSVKRFTKRFMEDKHLPKIVVPNETPINNGNYTAADMEISWDSGEIVWDIELNNDNTYVSSVLAKRDFITDEKMFMLTDF